MNETKWQRFLRELREFFRPALPVPMSSAQGSGTRTPQQSRLRFVAQRASASGMDHSDLGAALRSIRASGNAFRSGDDLSNRMDDLPVRSLPATASVSQVVNEWLNQVTAATTSQSLSQGDPRLRVDAPDHLIENFVDLTERVSPQMRQQLVDATTHTFNTPEDNDIEVGLELIDAILEEERRRLEEVHSKSLDPSVSVPGVDIADDDAGLSAEELDAEELQPSSQEPPESNFGPPRYTSNASGSGRVRARGGVGAVNSPLTQTWARVSADLTVSLSPIPKNGEEIDNPMTVHRHVQPNQHTKAMRQPAGASPVGSEPRNWDRYADDGAIFTSKRPGGVLLIDCSGSMSWDFEKLRVQIKDMPAATIALYSGSDEKGKLCIIAEKGRWGGVDPAEMQGGNEIDLEALEWLAKQDRGPKIWLSDGQIVGGKVDRIGRSAAARQVDELCKSNQIVRADTVQAAITVMRHPSRHNIPGIHRPGTESLATSSSFGFGGWGGF